MAQSPRGGQNPKGKSQRELARKVARDDRVHIAQQDGQEEPARERNEYDRDQLRRQRFAQRVGAQSSGLLPTALLQRSFSRSIVK